MLPRRKNKMRKITYIAFLAGLLLLLISYPVYAAEPSQCESTYKIVRGDWLSRIAKRCGLSLKELLEANPEIENPARIYPGQLIVIPTHEPDVLIVEKEVHPGGQVLVELRGFPANTLISYGLYRPGQDILLAGSGETDSLGMIQLNINIPEDAKPGQELIFRAIPLTGLNQEIYSSSIRVTDEERVHIVKPGDRLSRIAANYKTTVAAFLELNPEIENPHRIFTGQRLIVPPEGYQAGAKAVERAESFRAAPPTGLLVPTGLEPDERWIAVDLSSQTVHAYEGERLVRSFLVSTGKPSTPTVTGQYRIYVKLEKTDMRGPGYHLRDVPFTMYFYRGYGLHGTYWHSNFGNPMSAGCVNLTVKDSEWLYNFASVGTLVSVYQ
jgi:lipoprotein-anchoring transpeptidase ErfK/SrfK